MRTPCGGPKSRGPICAVLGDMEEEKLRRLGMGRAGEGETAEVWKEGDGKAGDVGRTLEVEERRNAWLLGEGLEGVLSRVDMERERRGGLEQKLIK